MASPVLSACTILWPLPGTSSTSRELPGVGSAPEEQPRAWHNPAWTRCPLL